MFLLIRLGIVECRAKYRSVSLKLLRILMGSEPGGVSVIRRDVGDSLLERGVSSVRVNDRAR